MYSGGATGGGGGGRGQLPPYVFFLFVLLLVSSQRSVMAMMIPLPHYGNLCRKFFEVGKNVSESPPKQTPWRRPCVIYAYIILDLKMYIFLRTKYLKYHKILKEIAVLECENAKKFLSSLAYA